MRIIVLVEAVVALGVGGGAGMGYLYASDTLLSSGRIEAIQKDVEAEEARLVARQQEERAAKLAAEKAEVERQARLKAQQAEDEARRKAEEDAKKKALADAQPKGPAYGLLNIKALSADLDVDGGGSLKGKGKSVDLKFDDRPGRITIKSGKYTIVLDPRPNGKTMGLGVTVKPLAIVLANDIAKGTSANDLEVDKNPFKLDFRSPGSPDFNLILTYKK